MRGRGVEVIIQLLHVLAVIALAVGQAKEALLENRIVSVPQRQREAKALAVVAETRNPVLAPAIGAAAGVIVRQIFPGGAAGRNPRAPCPIGARRDKVPTAASFPCPLCRWPGVVLRRPRSPSLWGMKFGACVCV